MKTRFGRAAPVSTDTHDEVSGAGALPTALLSPRRELLGVPSECGPTKTESKLRAPWALPAAQDS